MEQGGKDASPLWKVMIRLYEAVWQTDLGLSGFARLKPRERHVLSGMIRAVGNDWRNERKWLIKIRRFAAAMEPLLLDLEVAGSRYIDLPDDFRELFDDSPESPIGSDGESLDEQTLRDQLKTFGNNPAGFAGCVSALTGKSAEEAIRLMYRTRAREINLTVAESKRSSLTRLCSGTMWANPAPIRQWTQASRPPKIIGWK